MLADPPGSSLYAFVRTGVLQATGSGSITEGIGIARITANLKDAPIDDAVHVADTDTVTCVYRLLLEEGLFLGSTSGINVAAAVQVARTLGPGHTIVTVLCDGGARYQSRLFNRAWLEQKGLAGCAPVAAPRRLPGCAAEGAGRLKSVARGAGRAPVRRARVGGVTPTMQRSLVR